MKNLTEFILLKSRSGRYKDNPENRRKHRVGQLYGQRKPEENEEDEKAMVEIENFYLKKIGPNVIPFDKKSEAFAKKFGIRVTPVNIKSIKSTFRKMKLEGARVFDLKDILRNTFIVDSSNINEILFEIKGEFNVVRHKIQEPEKFAGYSGHILNIKFDNGVIGEIQVNTPQMIFGKEKPEISKTLLGEKLFNKCMESGITPGKGHELYEKIRVLPKGSEEVEGLIEESKNYYNKIREIKL